MCFARHVLNKVISDIHADDNVICRGGFVPKKATFRTWLTYQLLLMKK